MTLLITVLVVIRNILILILERTPRVKIVEEVVEIVDFLLRTVLVAELRNGLDAGETAFGFENLGPEGIEFIAFGFFLGGRLNIGVFVDGVELASLNGVEENFGGFLDTFEEAVVLGATSSSFLIGVVTENLLAVGSLDLLFSRFVAVFRETEDGIVILALWNC